MTTRIVAAQTEDPDLDWGRALRRAMLAVADEVGPAEYGHPANWGAFVALGLPAGGQ